MQSVVNSSDFVEKKCLNHTSMENEATCFFKFDYDDIDNYLKATLGDDYIFKGYIGGGLYGKVCMYCTTNCKKCVAVKIQIASDTPITKQYADEGCAEYAGIQKEYDLLKEFSDAGLALQPVGNLHVIEGYYCKPIQVKNKNGNVVGIKTGTCCDSNTVKCPMTAAFLKSCSEPVAATRKQPARSVKSKQSGVAAKSKCKQCNTKLWEPRPLYIYAMQMGDIMLSKYLENTVLTDAELKNVAKAILKILETLGNKKLTHGDMHTDNITVVFDANNNFSGLKLIDTGRSSNKSALVVLDFLQVMRTLAESISSQNQNAEKLYYLLLPKFKSMVSKLNVFDTAKLDAHDFDYWTEMFWFIVDNTKYFERNCIAV